MKTSVFSATACIQHSFESLNQIYQIKKSSEKVIKIRKEVNTSATRKFIF